MFWIDKGVLTHMGKDYGFGDKLPEGPKGLPEATLKSLKKKGRIADKVPSASKAQGVADDEKLKGLVRELQGNLDSAEGTAVALRKKLDNSEGLVRELQEKLEAADELQAKLDSAEETVGEMTIKAEDSAKTISELTEQITKPAKGGK